MTIRFVSGDLFINRYNAQALAHGCNCQGIMGVGVAVGFKERYPQMYEEYRRRCTAKPRRFNLGDAFLWKVIGKPWVFNLGIQERPGPHAIYEAVEKSLVNMKLLAEKENIRSIAMPRIGAGYGGLTWEKVRNIIEQVFEKWQGTLYVYEEFVPGE
jgi:O-acetyl-ADP-ribose deacetylase (regulator of RNase III)